MHSRAALWALAVAGSASGAVIDRQATDSSSGTIPKPTTTAEPKRTSSTPTATATVTFADPCARASAASAAWVAANPEATTPARIPPSVAVACLESIPVDVERDVAQLDYLEPFFNWQSTLEQLADPPEGYLLPGVDVLRGLGQIRHKLVKGLYKSQFEFAFELNNLATQTADGHFGYRPLLLGVFTQFREITDLISISTDGIALPKIFLRSDVDTAAKEGWKPSEIVLIDDIDAISYLEAAASLIAVQDPDAQFNNLFANPAFLAGQARGGLFFGVSDLGALPDVSSYKLANGSYFYRPNWAAVTVDLEGVDSGAKLHEKFEVSTASTEESGEEDEEKTKAAAATDAPKTPTRASIPGYPVPIIKHNKDLISGYFLSAAGYEDVAVLSILQFEPIINKNAAEYDQDIAESVLVMQKFLKACNESNKRKLVIDVSGNGGGLVDIGFQLYYSLFQTLDVWDSGRIRAHDGAFALTATLYDNDREGLDEFLSGLFDVNLKPFKDFASVYGPQVVGQQNATHLLRRELGKTYAATKDYPNKSPFKPENIVVMTDGSCGSTCTIFTGLLNREHGVRTIALGGRPLELPMQAIGGVKGSQVLKFDDLQSYIKTAHAAALNKSDTSILALFADDLPTLEDPPLAPGPDGLGSFNYRNAYTRQDKDGLPVHFVYEAANCRLFYTHEMISNVTATWARVADVAFKQAKCAKGSSANADGTMGAKAPGYDPRVYSSVPARDSPGSLIYQGEYLPRQAKTVKKRSEKLEEELRSGKWLGWRLGPKVGTSAL